MEEIRARNLRHRAFRLELRPWDNRGLDSGAESFKQVANIESLSVLSFSSPSWPGLQM